jgi:site-specific DNA recombinase
VQAAIYLRQSMDRTGEGAAVQRQREDCEELCQRRAWVVAAVYQDNDTSASSSKPRKHYQRLLRDVAAGRLDVIVAWHPDRLHRKPVELEEFIALVEKHGVRVETVQAGFWDLTTPSGRLAARNLGNYARFEVEHKSERQKRGNRQRAMQGQPHASPRPFGYTREVVRSDAGKVLSWSLKVEPTEAKAVRAAYRRLLAGASLRSIAAEWNEAGHLTSKGKPWAAYSVRDRLKSPLYAGLVFYDGQQVTTGNWKPVVKEETWRAAVALLEQPERRTTPGSARRYMLSGLALCGVDGCGALMSTGRTQHGKRTYQCSKTRHLSRDAEPIDALIEQLVVGRLGAEDARELLHDVGAPDHDDLREQAQALRAREDELAVMLAEGALNRRQFEIANAKVAADLAVVEARMRVSVRAEALRGVVTRDAAKVWGSLSVDRRRAVIDALMNITLLPPGRGKRTFDPTTVAVVWRC